MAQLTFCGAAGSVTGSCYLLEVAGRKLLIDCGMFQERAFQDRNWAPFPFDPREIEAVLLTHSHIDHIGRLPLLAKQGFAGRIFGTEATCDLAELMLLDSAHIQEEDARFKTKRHQRAGRDTGPTQPLYTVADAEAALGDLVAVRYHQRTELLDGVCGTWNDAGHMLGSGSIKLEITENGQTRTIVFSGDVGVPDRVILRDPEPFDDADIVVCESTYGDRVHEPSEETAGKLRDVALDTIRRGGNLVVPAFAVGRTQALLYHLRELVQSKQIPPILTIVDSPMAVEATKITYDHPECYDDETRRLYDLGKDPIGYRSVQFCSSREQSKAINNIRGSAIIISASGMCTAGRIKHHLAQNLGRSESTILFAGYQAAHTLGRQLVEGADQVRLFGEMHRVRAKIAKINSLSGHADREGLMTWLGALKRAPEHVYITHGDADVAQRFAGLVGERHGWPVTAPGYGDVVDL